mgnify:CR=1 FL=1|jgi:tRNA threonylcarbamoyladenosine biosynthesis protein TsaE
MQRIYELIELESVAKAILDSTQGRIFLFYGKMGVGKTTLIKMIAKVLGVTDTVSSPTFSLVNEYRTDRDQTVFHFDFYRINNEVEALDMGIEEYFDSKAFCLIEWPEKIKNLLPLDAVSVYIEEMSDGKRKLVINNS